MHLREVTPGDAAAIRAVYAPYVEETAITFEEAVPAVEAFRNRIATKTERFPWYVCEADGELLGYAYGGAWRSRAAYRWSTETSIYLRESAQGQGVGTALYTALLDSLAAQGYQSAYAVITLPNPGSVAFHERFGFEEVGVMPDAGYKHGGWHDVAWWHRALGEHPADPPEPLSPADARDAWERALAELNTEIDP
ncbi:GNAT family N-acetyltransferase [Natronomonas sp. EA1]|uniref:GNAT family N-acetyltransferase n=1 Tax=Natronomonas sp. EA1 TaxID=3421655 RepID=UPI003EB7A867